MGDVMRFLVFKKFLCMLALGALLVPLPLSARELPFTIDENTPTPSPPNCSDESKQDFTAYIKCLGSFACRVTGIGTEAVASDFRFFEDCCASRSEFCLYGLQGTTCAPQGQSAIGTHRCNTMASIPCGTERSDNGACPDPNPDAN